MSSEYKVFYRIQTGLFFPTAEMQWKEKLEQADCKSSRKSEEQKNNSISSLVLQPLINFSQCKAPTITDLLKMQLDKTLQALQSWERKLH